MIKTRLTIFDCDGTLVDSQATIIEAMTMACNAIGLAVPNSTAIRHVVGLSLPDAMRCLLSSELHDRAQVLENAYREAFLELRTQGRIHEPLYSGVRETLHALKNRGCTLGIATGKGRQGLLKTLQTHDILPFFDTLQTADVHPGKPHPAMLMSAMQEVAATPSDTIFIGDTTFDMDMGRAANVTSFGVSWGYHPPDILLHHGAQAVLESFEDVLTCSVKSKAAIS